MTVAAETIKKTIRDIPDFPKKGVIFKDITPLLGDPAKFQKAVNGFIDRYKNEGIQKVLAVESRGFLLAAPVALALNAGLVPVRKKGKLPYKTVSASYALEYGTDTLEMHSDAIKKGEKVLILDDVLATGGTCGAVREMVSKLGGELVSAAFLIELEFLKGRDKLKDTDVFSLVKY